MFRYPSEFCVFYKGPFSSHLLYFDNYDTAKKYFEGTVAFSDVEFAALSVLAKDSVSCVTIIDYVKE